MAKYINTVFFETMDSGKRYFTTAIPAAYNPDQLQYVHTARMGDRWDTLAYKYLGSPTYWYVIARANGGVDGSMFIKPGTQVIIPESV